MSRLIDFEIGVTAPVRGSSIGTQAMFERLPFDELHYQIIDAAIASKIVQCADVRVIELRNLLGFALEALAELGIAGQ